MWDLPGPGLEPVSPALAGRFLTTVPPGKPLWPGFKTATKAMDSIQFLWSSFFSVLFSAHFYVREKKQGFEQEEHTEEDEPTFLVSKIDNRWLGIARFTCFIFTSLQLQLRYLGSKDGYPWFFVF